MELILELIFELIFEGVIEGSQNKKVPMPIRIVCGVFLVLFCLIIIGGIIFLAVNLFMKKEYLTGSLIGILASVLLIATIFMLKKRL